MLQREQMQHGIRCSTLQHGIPCTAGSSRQQKQLWVLGARAAPPHLRAAHLAGRHHLHGLGDLLDVGHGLHALLHCRTQKRASAGGGRAAARARLLLLASATSRRRCTCILYIMALASNPGRQAGPQRARAAPAVGQPRGSQLLACEGGHAPGALHSAPAGHRGEGGRSARPSAGPLPQPKPPGPLPHPWHAAATLSATAARPCRSRGPLREP